MVPILGPILLAALFIWLWSTGDARFTPDYGNAIANVSPWALTFYSLTLLGSTLHAFLPKMNKHQGLGISMIVVALAVCVYAGFIAVWRHNSGFEPGVQVYGVTLVLLLITITICYWSHSKIGEP